MTMKSRFWHEGIKTIKDLLEDRNLRRQVVEYFDSDFEGIDNIKPNKICKTGIDEKRDDLIILLEELGFVKIDWEGLKKQTRKGGNGRLNLNLRDNEAYLNTKRMNL